MKNPPAMLPDVVLCQGCVTLVPSDALTITGICRDCRDDAVAVDAAEDDASRAGDGCSSWCGHCGRC